MINKRKRSLFIAGVLLATATLIWQQPPPAPNSQPHAKAIQHLPQWQGKEATIWTVIPQQNTATAVFVHSLTHFQTSQRTLINQSHGLVHQTDHTYAFAARNGTLTPDQITLKQQAHVAQYTLSHPTIHIYSDLLNFTPSKHQLTTPAPVHITQQQNWIMGTGLVLNTEKQILELKSNVISHYAQD